jgi:hypothetical protein
MSSSANMQLKSSSRWKHLDQQKNNMKKVPHVITH